MRMSLSALSFADPEFTQGPPLAAAAPARCPHGGMVTGVQAVVKYDGMIGIRTWDVVRIVARVELQTVEDT